MASPQHSPLFESPSSSSSASSVSSSPAINPLSLLGDASHTPQTLKLVNISLSQHLIDYIVDQVIDTVDHAMNRPSTLLPASSSSKPSLAPSSRPRTPVQQKFSSFATTVITRAEIITPTLLLALVYIHRARPYLHIALEEWALERVFLGSLIVASKYANDSTLKNVHWALCTGVFGKRDVGRIEREFLAVLEWDLGVTENDILSLWEGLEWAVELKEHEERQKELARLEQEKQKLQLQLAQRQREQQQQSTNSTSKFFLYSGDKSRQSSEDSLDIPPPLPVKSRNHKRSSNVTPSTAAAAAAQLPARQVRQHSPSSSSVSSRSSSSSSSDSPSPATPEDLHSRYIVINESASSPSSSNGDVPPPLPPKKRGLTATTMELLRSFPFPGQQKEYHHHPYRNTSPQQVKHSRYATTDTCAATVRSTVTSSKRYRVLV